MEEINRCGGNSGACHGQMYNMGTLLRHGSEAQKRTFLPRIASGELRLQSMGVTEPTTGTDTTKLKTTAQRKGDRYVVNGQKVWISRVQHSDLMILLARTTPFAEVKRKSDGMSIFIVDLHQAIGHGLTVQPIANMVNHETNELFFDALEIPAENLIGEEGKGFKYILDGLNAERTLIAAECIGDGYWFIERAARYANERIVFDRPIGKNQGVQFPLADAYIEIEAANLMRGWDGRVTSDSAAATWVALSRRQLWRLLLEPHLGPATDSSGAGAPGWTSYSWFMSSVALENLLQHQPARWLPEQFHSYDSLLTAAVEAAVDEAKHSESKLTQKRWQWGERYPLVLQHPIFGRIPFVRRWSGPGTVPQSGDGFTVKQVGREFGPSERMTVDFANLENSLFNIVTGESGQLFSQNYMDQWKAWYGGTSFHMAFSDEGVKQAAKHELKLMPK